MIKRSLVALFLIVCSLASAGCSATPEEAFMEAAWELSFDAPTEILGLADGRVIIEISRENNSELLAVDSDDGSYLWNRVIGRASPSLTNGQLTLIQSGEDSAYVVGLDLASGEDTWEKLLQYRPDLVLAGPIFVSTTDNQVRWSDLRSTSKTSYQVPDECRVEKVLPTQEAELVSALVTCDEESTIVGLSLPSLTAASEYTLRGPGYWDRFEQIGNYLAISSSLTGRLVVVGSLGEPIAIDDTGHTAGLSLYGDVLGIIPHDRAPYFIDGAGTRMSPTQVGGTPIVRTRSLDFPFRLTIYELLDANGLVTGGLWQSADLNSQITVDGGRSEIQSLETKDGWVVRRVALTGQVGVPRVAPIDLDFSAAPELRLNITSAYEAAVAMAFIDETSGVEGRIAILPTPTDRVALEIFNKAASDFENSEDAVITASSIDTPFESISISGTCLVRVWGASDVSLGEGGHKRVAEIVLNRVLRSGCDD